MARWKVVILVLPLLVLAACARRLPEPVGGLTVEALKNTEYRSQWPATGVAKLAEGVYREKYELGAAAELVISFIGDVYAFGDLNGDGMEDAAVLLASSGGGSGTFISLEAVLNDGGKPKHVASALLGDRVRVRSIAIQSGEITVEMVAHGPNDPLCCPTLSLTKKYRLEGNALQQLQSS